MTTHTEQLLKDKDEVLNQLRIFISDDTAVSNYKKFQELRQKWYDLDNLPLDVGKKLISNFNGLLKIYYNNRNRVYHSLKNLDKQKKNDLCVQVEKLIEFNSTRIDDWNAQTDEIKNIENLWKTSNFKAFNEEERKTINKQFWNAYKQFFKNKKNFFKNLDIERLKNYEEKEELIQQTQNLQDSDNWIQTARDIQDLQKRWKKIGDVSKHLREEQYQRFKEICDYFFNNFRDNRKSNLKIKKIIRLQEKIKNWKTNINFLGHSKNALSIREDYQQKIVETEKYLKQLQHENDY